MVARAAGNAMSGRRHIPWFNPRELDDDTVLALNTGRDALLAEFFGAVRERIGHPGSFKHWLLTGTRGAGKSFFLRLVQVSFAKALGTQARFVLLPEEHRNIFSPHEFLVEARRMLNVAHGDHGVAPAWRVADPSAAWDQGLVDLLQAFPETLLVIGVENFDVLLQQAFSDPSDNARLRSLMNNEPRLMLLATAVQGDFDEQYDQRLFRQFEHHPVPRWDEADHRGYLTRRAQREGKTPSAGQLARIDAYSRYTGGNARAAAVLAAAILDEHDPLAAANDLDAAIDSMSDYYRVLIDRIPPNTRKLFDALVRGGDPASQTEIATRTGARQNEISRAFAWLVDHDYVRESREPGNRTKQYRVQDRLLVQFYRMRSIGPGQPSNLALMADLLADTLTFQDKWRFASRYAAEGDEKEARTLAELALKERGIDPALLSKGAKSLRAMLAFGENCVKYDSLLDANATLREIVRSYSSDAELKHAIAETGAYLRAASRGAVTGAQLVPLVENSLSACPVDKFALLIRFLGIRCGEERWKDGIKLFEDERSAFQKEEPDSVAALREDLALSAEYPLAASLQELSNEALESTTDSPDWDPLLAADWAARAAVQWQAAGQGGKASESLDTCFAALAKILDAEPLSEAPIEIAVRLEPALTTFPPPRRAQVREWKGFALETLGRFSDAYNAYAQARADRQIANNPQGATWNLGKMAWCAGRRRDIELALTHHRQALEESLVQQDVVGVAWNLGQIARHTAGQVSAAAAWQVLDAVLEKGPGEEVRAIKQLGDAVADRLGRPDDNGAFVLARDLLQGLAARPQYPAEACLRALWIDMIEMGVPHSLLRDLLGEWQCLFGAQYASLAALEQLLRDWLDDLDTPTNAREQRRKTLDPDLATTLTALGENLQPAVRRRLGLLPSAGETASPKD